MAGNDPLIQPTCDDKQVTFDLNKRTVWYWRRLLLMRYYCDLGKYPSINVSWSDLDKTSKVLSLHDEEYPFDEKSPASQLHRSIVQISYNEQKFVTITLFYTTKTCLVQGNGCQEWTDKEFERIK